MRLSAAMRVLTESSIKSIPNACQQPAKIGTSCLRCGHDWRGGARNYANILHEVAKKPADGLDAGWRDCYNKR